MPISKTDLRIVFFGTPDFAVESLKRLVDDGYNIVGVVTATDKPGRRGHHLIQSDVKRFALERNLPLLQPENLKDPAFITTLRSLDAQLFIVIAFRMLPEAVWAMPPLGTFNLHASLLPKYRGAAPINWAVMNGDTETGVTTFFLKHEIDTGDIIDQRRVPISRTDDVEAVHDRLMMLGADMVLDTVRAITQGTAKRVAQDSLITAGETPTPAPKIFKDTCRINWDLNGEAIYNHIRGLSPYPAAWTRIVTAEGEEHDVKIFTTAEPEPAQNGTAPGTITADAHHLWISTADGRLEILSLQLAGKRRMPAEDFMRGFNLTDSHCE